MNRLLVHCALVGLCVFAAGAHASPQLAKSKNCISCHATDKKLVGPSFRDIARKYAGDKNSEANLAKKIRDGGAGVWGVVPMPANPQVSVDEARVLARWVLATR